jgi:tetratricopeptide (TPR) repeat protein
MGRISIAAIIVLTALPLAAQQPSSGQSNGTPPAQQGQSTPNAPAPQKSTQGKQKPSEAEQNPFPEAQSEAAAHAGQPQDATPSAPAPQDAPNAPKPAAQNGKPSEADQNPFPEAQSEKAQQAQDQSGDQKPAQNDGQNPASPPGSGKSGQDYSSSHLKLLDLPGDSDAANPDVAGGNGHNAALATKDTQVGMFYLKTGDYKGAHDRFAEAAQADPGNADAVFGLAESARRLNLRDEAVRNYRLYLSALPDGPRAKDSRKALKELGVSPNS